MIESQNELFPLNTENAPQGSGFQQSTWPAEADALLTAKWHKGLSARTIAELLTDSGHKVSRNAVLGRARRLSLGVHPNLKRAEPKPPLKRRLLPLQRPGEAPKAEGCRFIAGEPDGINTLWCDAPVRSVGEPYCIEHAGVCYRAWEPVPSSPSGSRGTATASLLTARAL